MITFSKLGVKGQLGNQMFQIASTIGIADRHDHDYCFPDWKYSEYFENELPETKEIISSCTELKEEYFHYHEWDIAKNNYNLDGWLQSEKYFNLEKTKELFRFKPELIEFLSEKYRVLFEKKTILIAVRRGDFVNHPFYYQVKFSYYLNAIKHFFPDWRDRNLIFTSDDIAYCKSYFSFLKNAYFVENLHDIECMALGTLCNDFIINNSTFSWWTAYLGEKRGSKVIRPIKNFRGNFARVNNDKDFYPERWIRFENKNLSIEPRYYLPNFKARLFDFKLDLQYFGIRYKSLIKQKIKVLVNK